MKVQPRKVTVGAIGAAVVIAAISILAQERSSQPETHVIPDAISCQQCRITMRRVVSFGEDDGPGTLAQLPTAVVQTSAGQYLVIDRPLTKVFDATGRFVTTIGRVGEGPGEFRDAAWPIPLPGDSVLLVEPGRALAQVFSPEFKYVRSIRMPAPTSQVGVIRWPTKILFMGTVLNRLQMGKPLHIGTLQGERGRVEISGGRALGDIIPGSTVFHLATVDRRLLWAAEGSEYRMVQFDSALNPVSILQRRPQWWQREPRDGAPRSVVRSMHVDSAGLLWLFIRVAADRWKEGEGAMGSNGERLMGEPSRMYKTVVEVIDPRSKRVIARQTYSQYFLITATGNKAVAYTPTSAGAPRMSVYQFGLQR